MTCLNFYLTGYVGSDYPILSVWRTDVDVSEGGGVLDCSVIWWLYDFHDIVDLEASGTCVVSMNWWDVDGVAIILVFGRWYWLGVIRDDTGCLLGWLPYRVTRGNCNWYPGAHPWTWCREWI